MSENRQPDNVLSELEKNMIFSRLFLVGLLLA